MFIVIRPPLDNQSVSDKELLELASPEMDTSGQSKKKKLPFSNKPLKICFYIVILK